MDYSVYARSQSEPALQHNTGSDCLECHKNVVYTIYDILHIKFQGISSGNEIRGGVTCFAWHKTDQTRRINRHYWLGVGMTHTHTSPRASTSRHTYLLELTWRTSNGSWCMGIKSEMSGTVCVTFTWDMYIHMSCLQPLFLLLFVHYCNLMVCVVYWVGKWQSRGSTGMFGNLMAIYHIMLQFIQNPSRFVMFMIWK